ncbi:hypothetical protein MKY88_19555 [Lysinibacillus sp. FSL R7-0073]|uniref:hypothetical protein n=1 Tax=Lysinibacillus sp. FSL R7-0073 TaxID=2921669 RepID=UPI0030F64914
MSIVESMRALDGKRIVDENGEVFDARSVFEDILQEQAQKAQRQREGLKRKETKNYIPPEYGGLTEFIGCFRNSMKDIVLDLSPMECGVLITILIKMKKGKNGLLISGGKPMNNKDIGEHIGKGRTKTNEYLTKFVSLGILEEVENEEDKRVKNYRVNPHYHIMGKFPDSTEENRFIKLYRNKLVEMIDGLELSELVFIYKLLPICHHATFELVHNPTARYTSPVIESEETIQNASLEYFNIEELADFTNMKLSSVKRLINSLSQKGFLMVSKCSGIDSYTLHPHIVFPKGTKTYKRIQDILDRFENFRKEKLRRSKTKVS